MATTTQIEQLKSALTAMPSAALRSLVKSELGVATSFYKPGVGTRYLKTETIIERAAAAAALLSAERFVEVGLKFAAPFSGNTEPTEPVKVEAGVETVGEPIPTPEPAPATEPEPTPDVTGKIEKAITETVGALLKSFKVGVDEKQVAEICKREWKSQSMDPAQFLAVITKEVAAQLANQPPKEIVVKIDDKAAKKIEGAVHEKFETVLRKAKAGIPIMLVGPAGTGKTHLAHQIADALSRAFYFDSFSAGMSEGILAGRLLPVSEGGRFTYVPSNFVMAYETGGVYLGDEFDAADANTLTFINAALANGSMSLPNRPEKRVAVRHPDFVFIAAANTYGLGADRVYVGRNQLDGATRNRVQMGQVEIGYDADLEKQLVPAPILKWGRKVRELLDANTIRQICSTRDLINAAKCELAGETTAQWRESFFLGWKKDDLAKVPADLK